MICLEKLILRDLVFTLLKNFIEMAPESSRCRTEYAFLESPNNFSGMGYISKSAMTFLALKPARLISSTLNFIT